MISQHRTQLITSLIKFGLVIIIDSTYFDPLIYFILKLC